MLFELSEDGSPIARAEYPTQQGCREGVAKDRRDVRRAPRRGIQRIDAGQNQTSQLIGEIARLGSRLGRRSRLGRHARL